jgi:tRNA dimethylallyltransferase
MTRSGERVAAVVGPTAVGKSRVAFEVAQRLGAEIISIDSMQIYQGMDVGTAKPSAAERGRVPHHLVDVRLPSDVVTVAEFQALARAAISDVTARGRLPLLVGGSGLYFRAVVDDLRFPPTSVEVRGSLEAETQRIGAEALHARLRELDPAAAAKVEPANARRTIRALEVIELTGRPFSENARGWEAYESRYDLAVAGLRRPRPELFDRIERRVQTMLEAGLVEEVSGLRVRLGLTAGRALGYRQLIEAEPDAPLAEVAGAIARATKRFARRQESWFSSDPRIRWFDAAHADVAEEITMFLEPLVRDNRSEP